jgi:hypothetical protein
LDNLADIAAAHKVVDIAADWAVANIAVGHDIDLSNFVAENLDKDYRKFHLKSKKVLELGK